MSSQLAFAGSERPSALRMTQLCLQRVRQELFEAVADYVGG
jgi:ABC-type proline/glycine betaine transport system permease subunit